MYAGKKSAIALSSVSSLLVKLLIFAAGTLFPVVLPSGQRPDVAPSASSSQHYVLAKLVMVDPPQGEESMLDNKFKQMVNNLGRDELSDRVDIRSEKEMWEVKKCGEIRSCEVLSIEIDEVGESFSYTATTRLINAAAPDAHPPLHWQVDCPFDERGLSSEKEKERAILNTCHIPEIQFFAKLLVAHDHERHGGNR